MHTTIVLDERSLGDHKEGMHTNNDFFFSLQRYGEAQIGLLSEPFNNGMLKAEDVKVENTRSSFYITHLSTDFSVLIFRLNLTQSLSI